MRRPAMLIWCHFNLHLFRVAHTIEIDEAVQTFVDGSDKLDSTMQDQQKPPSFPNLPKSALFSKLEAFLPVMAEENKKLSDAVAAGEGAKHNIEVEENEEQSDEDGDDAMTGGEETKAPVIEMNFALGMMDEHSGEAEDTGEMDQIKAATKAKGVDADLKQQQEKDTSFQMRLEKPCNKPRPVIQELN